VVILALSLTVFAQRSIDKQARHVPTKDEIEANERMAESLRSPTFIRLRLLFLNPNTDETSDLAPPYKSGDPIAIRLILNHFFNGPITFTDYLNQYRNLQLELLRDGDVVPYKTEVQQSVERARIEPPNDGSATRRYVPEKDYVLQRINLSEWYQTLLPAHYQLTVKRRFVWDGEWVQSDSITFDVAQPNHSDSPSAAAEVKNFFSRPDPF
jgi:hypothetical protein